MKDSKISESPVHQFPESISWEEQLRDHYGKIDEYAENCRFRGCDAKTTIPKIKSALKRAFGQVVVEDPAHPRGRRHLLIQEVLDVKLGACRIGQIIEALIKSGLAHGTCLQYLNELRYFCAYVITKPNIPGTSEITFAEKYGPIALSFSKYDLPIHAQDRPRKRRLALAPELVEKFYEYLRTGYLPEHKFPHIAARNYTAIVLQTEIGARVSELLTIESQRDIDREGARVRLFGKAKAYSGKRIRWVPLTELAVEVIEVFERVFKPMFPKAEESKHLFLNFDGEPLSFRGYCRTFRAIVEKARNAGVPLPEDLRPHDLRRTFATNKLAADPLSYRKVLKQLGHSYPSSAAPYLIATDENVAESQADLIDIFVDPSIIKVGGKDDLNLDVA